MNNQITVIIPCYNSEKSIKSTLLSILNQTLRVDEVVVIDDGSTDKTRDIVKSIQKNYKKNRIVLFSQNNKGVSAARNKGVEISRGDWIAFCDSDDYWIPEKNQKVTKYIKNNPALDFIAHEYGVGMNNTIQKVNNKQKYNEKKSLFPQLYQKCLFQTSSIFIKKSLFNKIGGFDEDLKVAEDYDMWLKVSDIANFCYIKELLGVYTIQETNKKNLSADEMLMFESTVKVLKRHINKLYKYYSKQKTFTIVFYRFARLYIAEIMFFLKKNEIKNIKKILIGIGKEA